MSRLVARILLAILMLPAASMVYLVIVVMAFDGARMRGVGPWFLAGAVTWAFVAFYWFLLWRDTVKWTQERMTMAFLSALGCCLPASLAGIVTSRVERDFGAFVATATAILLWLIAITLISRETAQERGERLRSIRKGGIVCPSCGYNLTGLQGTRCPECGTFYTLDELLAGQPSRADADVDD
jgi:hypothetical protein